jgi:uncharacterized protein YdaU (DUF1376 family)
MTKQHIQPGGEEGKTVSKQDRKYPWYKRYPEAYLRGTRRLSIAARGAYSDILDLMFIEDGGLPDDNRFIACHLHITGRQWLKLRKELFDAGKLFVGTDGLIHHRRADDEIEDRVETRSETTTRPKVGPVTRTKLNVINGGRSTESESDLDVRERGDLSRSPKEEKKQENRERILVPLGTDDDGARGTRLPFTAAAIADVEKLGIDPAGLYERYQRKTLGKRIADPSAYLLEMARDQAAKSLGCDPGVLKGATSRNQAEAVMAQCAALGTSPHGPQPLAGIIAGMNPKRSDGAALVAALNNRRRCL